MPPGAVNDDAPDIEVGHQEIRTSFLLGQTNFSDGVRAALGFADINYHHVEPTIECPTNAPRSQKRRPWSRRMSLMRGRII